MADDIKHRCCWPDCEVFCPPRNYMCARHWFVLPVRLRDRIWDAYRPGQEYGLAPRHPDWEVANNEVQEWIKERGQRTLEAKPSPEM